MDKNVTVKLYSLERSNENTPRFIEVLREIHKIQDLKSREKKISQDFEMRLEHMVEENSHVVCGELTRIQTTNYPSELTPEGRRALATQNRLGHSVVFRANHHRGLLGIEYNNRVCSPGRFISYLREFNSDAQYEILPVVRDDAWERYNRAGPRKVQISVASPSDLRVLEGEAKAVGAAVADMAEAYIAPKITIEISMGHARGQLGSRTAGLLKGLLRSQARDEIQLEKLKVYNPEANDGIDFVQEFVTFRERLELHDRDPNVNFDIKNEYLRQAMNGMA